MGTLAQEIQKKDLVIPIHILVDLKREDIVTTEHIQNISRTGIFIETRELLPIGSSVLLSFVLPDAPRLITVRGEVVCANRTLRHKRSSTLTGMGIRFAEINPEDEKLISAFIEKWEAGQIQV